MTYSERELEFTFAKNAKKNKNTHSSILHWKVKIFNNNILRRKVCLVMFLTSVVN